MKKRQYFVAGIVILVILGIAIAVIFNDRNKNVEEDSSSKVVTVVSEEESDNTSGSHFTHAG